MGLAMKQREMIRQRQLKILSDIDKLILRFLPFITGSAVAQQVMTQLKRHKEDLINLSEDNDQYIGQLEDELRALKIKYGIETETKQNGTEE